jgi:hypothetical protein
MGAAHTALRLFHDAEGRICLNIPAVGGRHKACPVRSGLNRHTLQQRLVEVSSKGGRRVAVSGSSKRIVITFSGMQPIMRSIPGEMGVCQDRSLNLWQRFTKA